LPDQALLLFAPQTEYSWEIANMFSPVSQASVVQVLREQVRALILRGDLVPGAKLPVEKELIKQLRVSRPALREALRALVGEGLLDIRPGRGTFVREPSSAGAIRADMVELLLRSEDIEEIQEVRRLLEPEIAARVARLACDQDLEGLGVILARAKADPPEGLNAFDAGWTFHRRMAQVAGNSAMAKILDVIYEMIKASEKRLYDRHFDPSLDLQEHWQILDVLKKRDPDLARAKMKSHMDFVGDHLNSALLAEQRETERTRP
jgi:GntR family transcriptional repressor for pyruvate dehydrogenase complex